MNSAFFTHEVTKIILNIFSLIHNPYIFNIFIRLSKLFNILYLFYLEVIIFLFCLRLLNFLLLLFLILINPFWSYVFKSLLVFWLVEFGSKEIYFILFGKVFILDHILWILLFYLFHLHFHKLD
jgi:hypothetical protein